MSDAQQQEQALVRACIPYLKNGIENFHTLASIILEYDESKNQTIREVILKAKESLKQSDSAASAELSKVDEEIERLTARIGQLEQQQADKKKDLEKLKRESQYIIDCIETYRVSLADARASLDSVQETLAHIQSEKKESETVRNVGIGLMFFPFVGTIIGAIMVGISETDVQNAKRAVSQTEEEVKNSEREVDKYSSKLEQTKTGKKEKKEEIAECNRTIEQIKQSLEQVAAQRNNIARVQEKIRSAVNMLDILYGRANVLKTQTEYVMFLPPVMNTLGEIIKKMLEIPKKRKYVLLDDPDVKAAILSLKEIYEKVSAIADQQTLNEIQFM